MERPSSLDEVIVDHANICLITDYCHHRMASRLNAANLLQHEVQLHFENSSMCINLAYWSFLRGIDMILRYQQ